MEHFRPRVRAAHRVTAIALVLLVAAVASPPGARASFLNTELSGGVYAPELSSIFGTSSDSATGYFVSPTVTAPIGDLGLGLRYLYASYDLFATSFDKHDIDLTLSYLLGSHVQAYAGFRTELQRGSSGAGAADFDLFAFPIGAHVSYPYAPWSLVPYASATVFPYARVSARSEQTTVRIGSFGGFAVEAGLVHVTAALFDVPLRLRTSYRYQDLDVRDGDLKFRETVHQVMLGVGYTFRDLF